MENKELLDTLTKSVINKKMKESIDLLVKDVQREFLLTDGSARYILSKALNRLCVVEALSD